MAILVSYTDESGISHADAYVAHSKIRFDVENKIAFILVSAYKSRASRVAGKAPLSGKKTLSVNVDVEDYENYFSNEILNTTGLNYITQCYKYLKSIDPNEENSKHSYFCWDLKNDGIHSLSSTQRDDAHWAWVSGDVIYNETIESKQQYDGSTWNNI